jgi:hypothetical protein
MTKPSILRKLGGGDRRSIGRSSEVVTEVLANPALFGSLFAGLFADDPVVRARAADAVEKISVIHPEYLRPYKSKLIGQLARGDQKEVRWHIAQMLPRLQWTQREERQVWEILKIYLQDTSSIVKTFAMQALADLAQQRPALRPAVLRQLQNLTASGTPAMRARGRKLLADVAATSAHQQTSQGAGRRVEETLFQGAAPAAIAGCTKALRTVNGSLCRSGDIPRPTV